MNLTWNEIIILFFLYSIMGWIMETIYRSVSNGKLYNPGMLTGPYVPLYGFAGVLLEFIHSIIQYEPLYVRAAAYCIIITAIEYVTGEIIWFIFKKRWWDYSGNILNFRGHICPSFSIMWMLLALFFETLIFPYCKMFISIVPDHTIIRLDYAVVMILSVDVLVSSRVIEKNGMKILTIARKYFIQRYPGMQLNRIMVGQMDLQVPVKFLSRINNGMNSSIQKFSNRRTVDIKRMFKKYSFKLNRLRARLLTLSDKRSSNAENK